MVTEYVADGGVPGEMTSIHQSVENRRGHRLAAGTEMPPVIDRDHCLFAPGPHPHRLDGDDLASLHRKTRQRRQVEAPADLIEANREWRRGRVQCRRGRRHRSRHHQTHEYCSNHSGSPS